MKAARSEQKKRATSTVQARIALCQKQKKKTTKKRCAVMLFRFSKKRLAEGTAATLVMYQAVVC